MAPVSFPEGSKLLYAVGVLFGVLALAYFGSEFVFALSPTVKAILLFVAFVVLLVLASAIERPELDAAVYALAAGSYLVFVWYLIATSELGRAASFSSSGSPHCSSWDWAISSARPGVARRTAVGVLIVGVVLAGGLIAADALGPQPTYTTEFDEEVEHRGSRTVVGRAGGDARRRERARPLADARRADLRGVLVHRRRPPSARRGSDRRPRERGGTGLSPRRRRVGELRTHGRHVAVRRRERRDPRRLRGGPIPVETASECPTETDGTRLVIVDQPSNESA